MSKESTQRKQNSIKKVYLYKGEVDARRETAVQEVVAKVVDQSMVSFDLEKFDGNTSNAEDIITAIATLPMGDGRKTVVVDRVNRLAADDQERIARFIPSLPDRSCMILLAEPDTTKGKSSSSRKATESPPEDNEEEGKKQKKGLRPALTAAVKKHGEVVQLAKLKADGIRALVADVVRSHGKKIDSSAMEAIVSAMSTTPSLIPQETAKLVSYVGDRETIKADDVDKAISKSPEDLTFRVIDAIAARQPARAIKCLEETYAAGSRQDTETLRMLAMLARHFRLLYQTKFLITEGRTWNLDSVPEELRDNLMQELNPFTIHQFQKDKLPSQTRSFTLKELEQCLRQVLACELSAKGLGAKPGSARLQLEMLVLKLSQRK